MPVHRCGSSALCLHDIDSWKHLDGSGDFEYVEVDPTGRYGRYKEVLGKGAFKTVYRAFDQEEGIEVAWNQIQLQDVLQTAQDVDRLYSEVHLLKTLKHKNIIKFYHSWVDKKANTVNFITEIFTSGTLRQYRKRHKHIDIKAVKNWSRQILRGLLYLHSHDPPIIHRDLKCDNIFINGNQGEVKIGDLGLAKILQHAQPARSVIGTPEFMAPELYEEEYTELVDIYSFGMCLLELATSDYPYSECTNAAQIYKKVSSGKKPEALKKVKDLGLCQFIEKCLATASQRLPARELLMDPFLQCEDGLGDINRTTHKANGVDQFIVHSEEPHGKSATVHISYKLKETISTLLNDSGDYLASSLMDLKCGQGADEADNPTLSKATFSNSMKDDRARQVDFRVHGKRREDDNVHLKLRIADAEGQVRNIHFPFDVEIDTALCVASEMVAELDLTDQDVTKIAEMIDAAILALVPEWKPGVAIDEAYNDNEAKDDSNSVCREDLISTATAQISLLSGGLCEDEASPCSPTRSDLRPFCILKTEGAMHGRFEEVVYQCHNSEFPVDYMTVSSISTDFLSREAHWGLSESSSSSFASVASICESDMHVRVSEDSLFNFLTDCRALVSSEGASTSLQLEGTRRGLDVTDTAHEMWERSVQAHTPHAAFHTGSLLASISHKSLLEACPSVPGYQNLQHSASGPLLFKPPWGWEENCDEYVMKELTELSIKHEQEIQDLRRKHEEALSQLRDRWRQRSRAFKINQKCECPLRLEDATLMNDKSALAYDAVKHDECALLSEQATAPNTNNYIEHGLLKLARNDTSPSRVFQNPGSFYRSAWSLDDSSSIGQ